MISTERVEQVVVETLESTPKNATHWSRAKMAERSGLSKSTIGRISAPGFGARYRREAREEEMGIVHDRATGIDISKRDATVCIQISGTRSGTVRKQVTTYRATTNEILRLRGDLEAAVTIVVTEAILLSPRRNPHR